LADPLVFSLAPRLSFLWHHDRLLFATHADSATVKNIALVSRVRVALDGVRDVVIIDDQAELASSAALSSNEIQACLNRHGSDPRTWADTVIGLTPMRIQAWREENEIAGHHHANRCVGLGSILMTCRGIS